MHRDIVTVAPPDAETIGSNEKCACQAFIIPGRVLSVQGLTISNSLLTSGHPEFNKEIVEFLARNRFEKGLFGKEVFDEAYPHTADDHDGVKVAEGIINFVSEVKVQKRGYHF